MRISSTARRYGRAIARVAIANKLEKTVCIELQGLWEYFRDNPIPRLTLESPATTTETRLRLLDAIEKALPSLSVYTKNGLKVLVENRRFALFHEVVEACRAEVDRYHEIVEVSVTSAEPLDDKQRELLRGTIQRTLAGGKDVRLDLTVDPRLLAGLVARVGSVVYDGSLRHQLGQIRQQLSS